MNDDQRIENVIVIGGACAGYTAALYAARAELEPLVIEGFQWGGQLQNTTDVENYPGFPESGIMGPELMQKFRDQAERFGTRFITDDATKVELSDGGLQRVWVGDDEYVAKTVILAMGAEPKRLGVPGEIELGGRGVSTCGVCDGAFFKGEDVMVVGGGDSAMEDSIFISKFADTLKHRPPPSRVPRLEDHVRARQGQGQHRAPDPVRPRGVRRGRRRQAARGPAAQRRDRRGRGGRGRRRLRRDRPHAPLRARRGPGRHRRERLRRRRRALHPRPSSPASSRSATSSTTPTARRSPPPAPAPRAPSTPSGTCATPRPHPRPTGPPARSTRTASKPKRRSLPKRARPLNIR